MNRGEHLGLVAVRSDLCLLTALCAAYVVFEVVAEALVHNENVTITNFGDQPRSIGPLVLLVPSGLRLPPTLDHLQRENRG